jgi:hypothetical protein
LFLRFLILKTEVDCNGRCETPVGIARRLSSSPTEREHPGVVINYAF